ncbi:B3 domain-containing protein Os11g0197600-like [Chenopodium quinoa]|uniref:TF-B3 domain-containing protein n=1 Tax=Chenopodium quinoa TaxID=63459 RepID=A0A803NAC7_CHEQI|nr:B3 domain-containing protein Os11g0197600-like [Chenopodium quinoa]XP_021774041.1 B3 domain-containing protein Os11g0197600-like [Chenopodium quinoa]XP_021774042.1 B3 domain-containing protein Os11g0197600-like [Chenopodium quinoa]
MTYVCETCKALEEDKYWNEIPPRKHRFFKLMIGNFEQQLRIPRKFVECSRADLSSSCTLRGQSGNIWKVQIQKTEKDVLFVDGWGNFVTDHGIKYGCFLVFCYVGDSSFEVSVFDATGCEVEGSHFTRNTNMSLNTSCRSLLHVENDESKGDRTLEADIDGSVEAFAVDKEHDSDSSSQENNFRGSKSAKCKAADNGTGIVHEEEDLESLSDSSHHVKRFHNLSLNVRNRACQVRQPQKYYKSKRRKVTEQEKQGALSKAISHMSRRRHMIEIVMKRTHVYRGFHLTIPKEWAVKHLLQKSDHDVILRVPGVEESWTVGCRWTPSQCQFRPGWSTFVLENNLEEHDVCVFELLQKGDLGNENNSVFDVHIFRVVKEVVPLTVLRGIKSSV